jgi:hypothetical protein
LTKRELESEQELDPSKNADEIIQSGKWEPYANRIITSGKWKSYFSNGKIIAYTFREAATIEEHQKNVCEERLGNLRDMFRPLPPLRWKEKEENERFYWTRIRTETRSMDEN